MSICFPEESRHICRETFTPTIYNWHDGMDWFAQQNPRWWQLKHLLFAPQIEEMVPFDFYFSNGVVQPPPIQLQWVKGFLTYMFWDSIHFQVPRNFLKFVKQFPRLRIHFKAAEFHSEDVGKKMFFSISMVENDVSLETWPSSSRAKFSTKPWL